MATEEKEETKEFEMEYRRLGGTGLIVSVLGFGCMAFTDVEQAKSLLKEVRKFGVNFFDSSELYGSAPGVEETIFGEAYAQLLEEDAHLWRRSDMVITTKLFTGGMGVNERGCSRKHLMEGINASLKRMKLDYVDVLFAHRPDRLTPVEETVRAFNDIINQGKAFYWGTSEWSAIQIERAVQYAEANGLIKPCVEQPEYNLLVRENVEVRLKSLYEYPCNLGLTTWSPVYGGFFTSRTLAGYEVTETTRANVGPWIGAAWRGRISGALEKNLEQLKQLTELAKEYDAEISQLAIAWVIKNPRISVCLLGGSKTKYMESNIRSLELARKLTATDMEKIEGIMNNTPEQPNPWGRVLKKTI